MPPKPRHPALCRRQFLAGAALLGGGMPQPDVAGANRGLYLETSNGWYMHNGKPVWGYARSNTMWGGYRGRPTGWWTDFELGPSLIRNDPEGAGPNRTEDLDRLTDAMLAYGYPGFEHCPPLWYDRRRDAHDVVRREDPHTVAPLLELPWARSGRGRAWDGLPLYDLTRYNPWYFARLREFAALCDRKGGILFFNFYNQHNLLETQAHYADYPWRPVNCIQETGLPDRTPVANVFYDVTHDARRRLHSTYIRHCLDVLKGNCNVVLLTGTEFTGALAFAEFWFDTILEWEWEAGRCVHIGLGATKDVVDAVLRNPRYGPRVGTIDLRYRYRPDGTLYAPEGGQEVPGRYVGESRQMTPQQIYTLVKEYRQLFPDKAIIHDIACDQQQTMAFLVAGGSMLVRWLDDVQEHPAGYTMPVGCEHVIMAYGLLRTVQAEALPRMRPLDVVDGREGVWCLGEPGRSYLVYMMTGRGRFRLDLSGAPGIFDAKWVGCRLGKVFDAFGGALEGGKVHQLSGLDWRQWMLWLSKRA